MARQIERTGKGSAGKLGVPGESHDTVKIEKPYTLLVYFVGEEAATILQT